MLVSLSQSLLLLGLKSVILTITQSSTTFIDSASLVWILSSSPSTPIVVTMATNVMYSALTAFSATSVTSVGVSQVTSNINATQPVAVVTSTTLGLSSVLQTNVLVAPTSNAISTLFIVQSMLFLRPLPLLPILSLLEDNHTIRLM